MIKTGILEPLLVDSYIVASCQQVKNLLKLEYWNPFYTSEREIFIILFS